MKIVEAKKKDINSIATLSKEFLNFHRAIDKYYRGGNKKSQKEFKKYLLKNFHKKNFKILVAVNGREAIGYFIGKIEKAKPHISPKKIGKISSAFVVEKYRRRKIGEKAIQKLIQWFKDNKISFVETDVDARNKIGIKAWKKFGFFEFQKKMRLDL